MVVLAVRLEGSAPPPTRSGRFHMWINRQGYPAGGRTTRNLSGVKAGPSSSAFCSPKLTLRQGGSDDIA